MPIYEYRCTKGHTFEIMQSMSDEPITACTECRSPVERVFHPVAVHFKGSGFYTTDYGRKRSGGGDSAGGDTKKDSTTEKSESSSGSSDNSGSSGGSESSTGAGSAGKSESASGS